MHRRNCWFICKYGRPGVSILELRRWPISHIREAAADVAYWLKTEAKNSKGK